MIASILGFIGAWFLGMCAVPLVFSCIKDGHAHGVNSPFLALWLGGEYAMLGHVLLAGSTLPVLINLIANTIMASIVGWYRWVR